MRKDGELAEHQNYLDSLYLVAEYVHFMGYLWSVAPVQAGRCSAYKIIMRSKVQLAW